MSCSLFLYPWAPHIQLLEGRLRMHICWAEVRDHIQKSVLECLMSRNHSIIFFRFILKKRLSRKDTDERFHLSTAQAKVKNFIKSSMRWVGTARYGLTNPFGKSKYGSTLVLSRISCIASGLALLEDEQKFKHGGCVGAHKTPISCTNISSKCMK
jgi:hypothetical protein